MVGESFYYLFPIYGYPLINFLYISIIGFLDIQKYSIILDP